MGSATPPLHEQYCRILHEDLDSALETEGVSPRELPTTVRMQYLILSDRYGVQLECGEYRRYTQVDASDLQPILSGRRAEVAEKFVAPFARYVAEYAAYPEGVLPDV